MNNKQLEELNFAGWPLPDEYLVELGRVTALWNSLESLMSFCLGKLAGFNEINDPKPFILLLHTSFPQRLHMFGALCEQLERDLPSLKDYKATITAMSSAQKERNRFVHNVIVPNTEGDGMVIVTGSARGSLKTKKEVVTIGDIRRTVVTISEAQRKLYKLVLDRDVGEVWKRRSSEASMP